MCDFEEIWGKIVKHEGEVFYTVRKLPFTYKVGNDNIVFSNAPTFTHSKKNVKKAFEVGPVSGPGKLLEQGITGPSYIYALLTDLRIK
ncbi:MAG: hypothetical protein PHG02_02700 [Oscillospiraceae bacterium]|nr:hypothetical protein [Oscillospiraceae bacterium]